MFIQSLYEIQIIYHIKMPDSCCIINWSNRRSGKNKSLSFYIIPKGKTPLEKRRRREWMKVVGREN